MTTTRNRKTLPLTHPLSHKGRGDIRIGDAEQARIVKIFSSLQGEGIRLGERHIFVRFGGCNLHCDYCDEPETIPIPSGELWSRERVEAEILRLNRERPHRAVSWTGGEPLLHAAFLEKIMAWTKSRGFQNYLETNGTLPNALRQVVSLCDIIAMDVKLPSATGRQTWPQHLEFLRVAPEKTFVKVILTTESTEGEWRQVIRLIQEAGPQIPLVLQPATPVPDSRGTGRRIDAPQPSKLCSFGTSQSSELRLIGTIPIERAATFLRQATGLLKDVRIIPQWHPVWNLP